MLDAGEYKKKYKIMVIDDDFAIRYTVRTTLEAANYVVKLLSDGRGAIETAKTWQPHVILLDMVMPGVDGFELYSRLTFDPQTEKIPVILMTVKEEDEIREKMYVLEGAEEFERHHLRKPFTKEDILTKIEALIIGKQQL